jgi:hypothetical protein
MSGRIGSNVAWSPLLSRQDSSKESENSGYEGFTFETVNARISIPAFSIDIIHRVGLKVIVPFLLWIRSGSFPARVGRSPMEFG